MNVTPEYSMATQAKIPCAIAALHNFICIHDPNDYVDDGPGSSGPCNETWTLLEIDGDERHEFPEEDLGYYVSSEEQDQAAALRDRVVEEMWNQYVNEGDNGD
ncbi:unnamed protein product [Mycena citricolor]|uniref:Uncharacterized protein n=1 Tax=Mycena citricolor TaxID=2018698 RepID=A0AAD2HCI0_9AGAR|nr:unnamed protein product [Mycena citricolor]